MALILLLACHTAIQQTVGHPLVDAGHCVIAVPHAAGARIAVSVVPVDLVLSTAALLESVPPALWTEIPVPRGRMLPLLTLGVPAPTLALPPWVLLVVLPGPWSRQLVRATVQHALWCTTRD